MLQRVQSLILMQRGGIQGLTLPKRRLSHAGRAENFGHLPAHEPTRDSVSWEALRRQDSVELRKACGHGARAPRMEVLEGL